MAPRRTPNHAAQTASPRPPSPAARWIRMGKLAVVVALGLSLPAAVLWTLSTGKAQRQTVPHQFEVKTLELAPGQDSRFDVVLLGTFKDGLQPRRIFALIDRLTGDAIFLIPGVGVAPFNLMGPSTTPPSRSSIPTVPRIPFLPTPPLSPEIPSAKE